MSATMTHDALTQVERTLTILHAKWAGLNTSVEIVRQHGGNVLPILDECDRIGAQVRAETTRQRALSRQMARELVAAMSARFGQFWDDDQYGEATMSETTMRFLNGGAEIDC